MRAASRCPRCGGNLLFNREDGAGEWRCLQCGRGYQASAAAAALPAPVACPTAHCLECDGLIPGAVTAKRRYCSDRCRMRAARRRWSDPSEQSVAV